MRDLRVSVTDRCNFHCLYCLPETEEAANFYRTRYDGLRHPISPKISATPIHREWKPKAEILSFEEITRVVRIAVALGIEKVRVTGGEPLLRQGVEKLIGSLSKIPGVQDLAMTTNGARFGPQAAALKQAGLNRVSFSMDSLDRDNFRRMTSRDGLAGVLDGIRLARELGFHPVKVNAVIIRGMNDHEIPDLVRFAMAQDLSLRFIEFMPLDSSRAWQKGLVVSGREILERLRGEFELQPVDASANPSETARRWRLAPFIITTPTRNRSSAPWWKKACAMPGSACAANAAPRAPLKSSSPPPTAPISPISPRTAPPSSCWPAPTPPPCSSSNRAA
jgi:cyclic pyranopterin phosphate synthase